jgi:hypothetical protein
MAQASVVTPTHFAVAVVGTAEIAKVRGHAPICQSGSLSVALWVGSDARSLARSLYPLDGLHLYLGVHVFARVQPAECVSAPD